jgi:hypothetical protein
MSQGQHCFWVRHECRAELRVQWNKTREPLWRWSLRRRGRGERWRQTFERRSQQFLEKARKVARC